MGRCDPNELIREGSEHDLTLLCKDADNFQLSTNLSFHSDSDLYAEMPLFDTGIITLVELTFI